MQVEFKLGIGYAGVHQKEVVDLPDDMSEDEIYEELEEWANQYIDTSFVIIEEDGND